MFNPLLNVFDESMTDLMQYRPNILLRQKLKNNTISGGNC
jgi:hypothetical protein